MDQRELNIIATSGVLLCFRQYAVKDAHTGEDIYETADTEVFHMTLEEGDWQVKPTTITTAVTTCHIMIAIEIQGVAHMHLKKEVL